MRNLVLGLFIVLAGCGQNTAPSIPKAIHGVEACYCGDKTWLDGDFDGKSWPWCRDVGRDTECTMIVLNNFRGNRVPVHGEEYSNEN